MINTKEVRAYIRSHMLSQKIGVDVAKKLTAICDELDALRKPVEGIERPDVVDTLLENAAGRRLLEATNEVLDYILALEAENRRLREFEAMYKGLCK